MPKRRLDSDADMGMSGPHGLETSEDGRTQPRHPSTPVLAASAKRRLTSCAACRKQKIKCELLTGRPPCERCKRRNIECVINAGLRNSILDQRQLAVLGRDMSKVHATLIAVCQRMGLDSPKPLESATGNFSVGTGVEYGDLDDSEIGLYEPSQETYPSAVEAPIDAYLPRAESPSGTSSQKPYKKPDLISKGLITLEDAETLVEHYLVELDPILYGFVKEHKTIHSLRNAAPALIAVVCTVAALHHVDYGHLFEHCYREYRHIVSSVLFEKQDVEHIRALCIGSFWLPGSSRILMCDAVRRAGDARLHRSILKAMGTTLGNSEDSPVNATELTSARDRVRLWYGLFMCDQHQSVLNNRESLLPLDLDILERRNDYLEHDSCTNHDVRLVAQSTLLLIMARIKRTFGSEYPTPVPESLSSEFPELSAKLDEWIAFYSSRFSAVGAGPEMVPFPTLAFELHYLFAKLYLGHHVFRGLQGKSIPHVFLDAAQTAHDAAVAIFRMMLEAEGLLGSMRKVPSYTHIMLSFAGHLILELCDNHREQLKLNVEEDYQVLDAVVSSIVDTRLISLHPLSRVASGLRKRLFEFAAKFGKQSLIASRSEVNKPHYQITKATSVVGEDVHQEPGHLLGIGASEMPNEYFFTDFSDFTFQDTVWDFTGLD